MPPRYYFRLDDICPTMDWDKFNALKKIFEHYGVKPILGVIPDNRDKMLEVGPAKKDFWHIIGELQGKGWIIAQHGYQHIYETKNSGLLKINNFSEFAGLPYDKQKKKILSGQKILEEKLGVKPQWWMAPGHSLDLATCQVLKELGFIYITDGIALYPYKKFGLTWLPQQIWRPMARKSGFWTVCIHPNSTNESYRQNLENFLRNHYQPSSYDDLEKQSQRPSTVFRLGWYGLYKLLKLKASLVRKNR